MNAASPLVCIVDDHDGVRESIAQLIATVDMRSRSYGYCRDFLADKEAHECDCLVLDVRLPDGNGLGLLEHLLAHNGHSPPTVFISGHGDIPMAVQAMRLGALDFLEKPFGAQVLLDRVHQAVARSVERRQGRAERAAIEAQMALLTPREHEVLRHMAEGTATKAIALALEISPRTVEHHRAQVLKKMRAPSLPSLLGQLSKLPR